MKPTASNPNETLKKIRFAKYGLTTGSASGMI